MIHVVSINNQHYYGRQLDEMFRMRHDFYVEGHGWEGLDSHDGLETDEFDNEDAVYLISLDKFGRVAAALRLNPSTGPNLTANLTQFVEGPAPHSPEIWDMTRWLVAPAYRGAPKPGRLMPGQEMGCGLMEFALRRGLSHFSMIAETNLVYKLDLVGWRYHPLGPETGYENGKGTAQALLLEANPEALMKARMRLGLYEDVLFEIRPADLPGAPDVGDTIEEQIAEQMSRIGRLRSIRTVQRLTDRLVDAIINDPIAAIEAITSYSKLLNTDLTAVESDEINHQTDQDSPATSAAS